MLIRHLPDVGAYVASVQGGPEFRGWGVDRHMQADRWDMAAKAFKKPPTYPRPESKKKSAGTTLFSTRPVGRTPRAGG